MKDDRRDGPPNVQLYSREGFGGPLSVGIRPTNGTEYLSVEGPHAPRRATRALQPTHCTLAVLSTLPSEPANTSSERR